MKTRVSAICEAAIEAGWLLAVVVVPLFFNVYSSRVFEPDKLSLLRAIAVLMAAAWSIKLVDGLFVQRSERVEVSLSAMRREAVQTPLVVPTLLLVAVYLLATATSVVPRTSLWGSYQRLQGTVSILSYVVIFVLMLQGLRRREQLDRLVGAMILTSLPVAMYGLLQHYELDPLPWGGDVTLRVASSMGNPIFVGAYLIMVMPLTLARAVHLQAQATRDANTRDRILLLGAFGVLFAAQVVAWSLRGPLIGLALGLLNLAALVLVAAYRRRTAAPYLLVGAYQLILSAQLVCLVFTQSRGPMLGLAAGLFFFGMLYIFARRWRRAQLALAVVSVVAVALLVLVNLPRSPLAGFRELPYVGRLGRLLETESGTGKVRVLIWQGAVEMIADDPVRALIGYGPEAMYVAYSRFYPPELAHYEKRNASPDRSHNETFDALVSTGVVGYLVYMALFGALFYHAFRWLGLVRGAGQQRLFVLCVVLGPLLGLALAWWIDGSWRFAGVALPSGFVAGLAVHACLVTLPGALWRDGTQDAPTVLGGWDLLLLVGVVAGIVAHFVEIHFGIAIAATRTYFWVYTAILVIVGSRRIPSPAKDARFVEGAPRARAIASGSKRRATGPRRDVTLDRAGASEPLRLQIGAMALITGAILSTLLWNYATSAAGGPLAVVFQSLTTMVARGQPEVTSPGLFWLVLGTLVWAMLVSVAEVAQRKGDEPAPSWWLRAFGLFLGVSVGIGVLYAWLHGTLVSSGGDPANTIYGYLLAALALWGGLAILLRARVAGASRTSLPSVLVAALVLVLCLVGTDRVHIAVVRADVTFKQGMRYDQAGAWDGTIQRYDRALAMAPYEDYYWLHYGRAFMERARQAPDQAMQQEDLARALAALERARELSPLNTDHTANLGRLYRAWSEVVADAAGRQALLEQSLQAYEQALQLSPHNAQLMDEWGQVYFAMGDLDAAEAKYRASLAIDPEYTRTHLLLGDVFLARESWPEAVEVYSQALRLDDSLTQGWSAMGYAYSQLRDWDLAVEANLHVLQRAPDDYNTLKNLALLYDEMGLPEEALGYAEQAFDTAPDQHKPSLQSLIAQLKDQIGNLGS